MHVFECGYGVYDLTIASYLKARKVIHQSAERGPTDGTRKQLQLHQGSSMESCFSNIDVTSTSAVGLGSYPKLVSFHILVLGSRCVLSRPTPPRQVVLTGCIEAGKIAFDSLIVSPNVLTLLVGVLRSGCPVATAPFVVQRTASFCGRAVCN